MHVLAFYVFKNFHNCLDEIHELDLKKLNKDKDKEIKKWEKEIAEMENQLKTESDEDKIEELEDSIIIEKNLLEDFKNEKVKYRYDTYFDDFAFTWRLLIGCIALDSCGGFLIGFTAIYFLVIYFKGEKDDDEEDEEENKDVKVTYPYN